METLTLYFLTTKLAIRPVWCKATIESLKCSEYQLVGTLRMIIIKTPLMYYIERFGRNCITGVPQRLVSKGTKRIAIGAMSRLLRMIHYLVALFLQSINTHCRNHNIESKLKQ